MKIYVASSWRNDHQPYVVQSLRGFGHEVYDFKNPSTGGPERHPDMLDGGFHWSDIDPEWEDWDVGQYRNGLEHNLAELGYLSDYVAMQWADACVCVLPSGRSAHLEAGWFVGSGRPLLFYVPEAVEPELMYKMGNGVFDNLDRLERGLRMADEGITEQDIGETATEY